MKYLFAFLLALNLTGCWYDVTRRQLNKINETCINNEGIYSITFGRFDARVYCKDGTYTILHDNDEGGYR